MCGIAGIYNGHDEPADRELLLRSGARRCAPPGMCGIPGIQSGHDEPADREPLLTLAGDLKHRGPDGTGLVLDGPPGMVNTRLATIDEAGGEQPISSDDNR